MFSSSRVFEYLLSCGVTEQHGALVFTQKERRGLHLITALSLEDFTRAEESPSRRNRDLQATKNINVWKTALLLKYTCS